METAGIGVTTFVHEPFAALISYYYDWMVKLSQLDCGGVGF